MKKLWVLITICVVIISILSAPFRLSKHMADIRGPTFTMPASLTEIEEEAFAGIGAKSAVMSSGVKSLGERAFADNPSLREIRLPDSIVYIAEHAFEGCLNLRIIAEAGSYASRWAREHDVAFTPVTETASKREKISKLLTGELAILLSFVSIRPVQLLRLRRRARNAMRSMRPQDRPELNPIDYRFP